MSALDLRFALRSLLRERAYGLTAALTLSLGIGAAVMMYSLVRGVLLNPLPYRDPDRLIRMFESSERYPNFPVSPINYLDYRRENRTLEQLAAYTRVDLPLSGEYAPEQLAALRVSANYFGTLGFRPALGRTFEPKEMTETSRVVILSHHLWQRLFHGDPQAVGRSLRLSGQSWQVVGVMPPHFEHVGGDYRSTAHGETVDLWWPIEEDPTKNQRSWHYYNVVARMKPEFTIEQAAADLFRVSESLAERYPDINRAFRAKIKPLKDEITGSGKQTVLLLFGAALLVLLVACVNVASLCLARGLARRQELSIRASLGAGRGRLFGLAIGEAVTLASIGAIAGAAAAAGGLHLLVRMMPADFPRLHAIAVDPSAALFAAILAVVTTVLFGVPPALEASRIELAGGLRGGRTMAGSGLHAVRLRSVLVVSEVALASGLLIAAGLLLRSYIALQHADHGFDGHGVLTFSISLPPNQYKSALVPPFFRELERKLQSLPGVEQAGFGRALPWTGYDENSSFTVVGRAMTPGEPEPGGRFHAATAGYFQGLRIPLLRGRHISPADTEDSAKVVVVNEALARSVFPNEEAVGKKLDLWGAEREIVGVVANIGDTPTALRAEPAFFWPHAQQPFFDMSAVVRVKPGFSAASLIEPARRAVQELDPALPIAEVRTMDGIMAAAEAQRRFAMWMIVGFAAASLVLAGIGTYGVLAYLVHLRRKEIGVRMALGARAAQILSMVMAHAGRIAIAGLAIGCLLALVFTRFLESFLYGVKARDAASFVLAIAVMLAAALLAGWIPSWQASRIDPGRALREE